MMERWLPDARLNLIGRRYNVACMVLLVPYVAAIFLSVIGRGLGWWSWRMDAFVLQVGWVVIWLPNLALIGLRAGRDYDRAAHECREAERRLREAFAAEAEFHDAHARRMAWARGEPPPEPGTPPTLN